MCLCVHVCVCLYVCVRVQLKSMRHQLTQIDAQLARVEKLLRIADPDGWLKPGSKAAAVSV